MRAEATIIDWKPFDAPSKERPFGLLLTKDERLTDEARTKLFQIAKQVAGPPAQAGVYLAIKGRWSASSDGRSWSFDTEGTRALFIVATKGEISALSC